MTVVIRVKSPNWLQWAQGVFFAGAVSMLAYCGFVLIGAWIFQAGEGRRLERLLARAKGEGHAVARTASPASLKDLPPVVAGGLIGRIEIPRLGVSVIVIEGISSAILRNAAGHIPGTVLPGQAGNVGISGHRDTFFRPLRNIRQNDFVTLTTILGAYRYRVVSIRIVLPNDVAVLEPSGSEALTLVTCYPFYFVGLAPKRFIVRAERVS